MESFGASKRTFAGRAAGAFFFAFLPLLACLLYTAVRGRSPFAVYLPAGGWNDELFYYKQIEDMILYGRPQGYFGYNETTARLLSFGPWSVVLLLPYALIGKVAGWTFAAPVLCNMLFLAAAFFIFGWCVKTSVPEKALLAAGVLSFTIMTRYVLSGMVEPLNFAMAAAVTAFLLKAVREDGRNNVTLYLLLGLCAVFTLMRPYYLVFFLFPGYFLIRNGKKKGLFLTTAALVLSVGVYFWINSNLCAPYVYPIIYTDWLDAFREQGFGGGLGYCFAKYGKGWGSIFSMAGASLVSRSDVMGKLWLLYLAEMAGFLLFLGLDLRKRDRKQAFLDGAFLGLFFVIASTIIMLYEVDTGSRHIMTLCLAGLLVLLTGRKGAGKVLAVAAAVVFAAGNLWIASTGFWATPAAFRSSEAEELTARRAEELAAQIELEPGVSWGNTLAWHSLADYRILYSLPAGMGIQYDESFVFTERMDSVKARYLLLLPDSEAEEAVKDSGAVLLWEDGDYRLYENADYQQQAE